MSGERIHLSGADDGASAELARIEDGEVPFDRFPDALRGIALTTPGLDLAALGLE